MWLGKDATQEWEKETCKCFKPVREKKSDFLESRRGMQLRLMKLNFSSLNCMGVSEKDSEDENNEVLKRPFIGQIP